MKTAALCFMFFALLGALESRAADTTKSSTALTDNTIRIGTIVPLTGLSSSYGKAILEGTNAFIKRINLKGGIQGRKIELFDCDDGYEPSRTPECFKKLTVHDKVFAIVSPFGGPTTSAVLPLLEKEDVVYLGVMTPVLISPAKRNVFVVRPSAVHEMNYLINKLIDDRGVKSFAILYQDDAFGQPYLNFAQKALAERGLSLKAKAPCKRNSPEVDAAVKEIAAAKPDVIILAALMPTTALFTKKYLETGNKTLFVGVGATSIPPFANETKGTGVQFIGAAYSPPLADESFEIVKAYKRDMQAAGFTDLQQYGAEAYLNISIFADALSACGKDCTQAGFAKALEGLGNHTVGGAKISFGSSDHQGFKTPFLLRLKDGAFTPVTTTKGD